jgi:hypothetical protein
MNAKCLSGCATVIALLCAGVSNVSAQTGNRVAIGVSLSPKVAPDGDSRGGAGIGFLWRLGHGSEGWGWKYSLNWYSAEIDQPIGAQRLEFGHLRVRPFLGGYGYTKMIGRYKLSANLMGGYAFNSFELRPGANDAYRQQFNAQGVDTDVSNTFVLKPETSLWFDVNDKIGLTVGAGYMIARPAVTVLSSAGRDKRRVNADMFMFKVGAVYSIF